MLIERKTCSNVNCSRVPATENNPLVRLAWAISMKYGEDTTHVPLTYFNSVICPHYYQ